MEEAREDMGFNFDGKRKKRERGEEEEGKVWQQMS